MGSRRIRILYGLAAVTLLAGIAVPGARWVWGDHFERAGSVADPGRPASCPAYTADPNAPNDGAAMNGTGTFPWPRAPLGVDPSKYQLYDHTAAQFPPIRPANWGQDGADWKLTSARTSNQQVNQNPQELCGVEGNSVDQAWQTTTGRPSTVIAILDSGIEWCRPHLVDKIYINRSALPPPENAGGQTKTTGDAYDLNGDGVFNVEDYAQDPRIARPYFCGAQISPEDLIRAFTSMQLGGPAGFKAAIAGWNFIDNSNDPYDDVHYDHGTGEAGDSSGAADAGGPVGACPNCMVLPVRVGDSFIANANDFAQGVAFAVDSGATLIQEALGTIDITNPARQAIDYAYARGVPIIASAADEAAEHHNLPSVAAHTIVVNSATHPDLSGVTYQPDSYLYLNGCTNFGANIAVTVESASCSSEATGKAAGITGLMESAAWDQALRGKLAYYPGLRSATGQPVPLSATEVRELIQMSADDVDFQTAAPPSGPPDNYAVVGPPVTTRYPSQPGFDMYFGYGRINAASIVQRVAAGDIPPEAELDSPDWFRTISTDQTVTIGGLVAAVRATSYRYQVQVAAGPQPEPGSWVTVAGGTGTRPFRGTLARFSASQLEALFPAGTDFSGAAAGPAGRPNPDEFTFSVRLVVVDDQGRTGMDRRADYLHDDATLLRSVSRYFGDSIDAGPALAPIGPGGDNALLVATANGAIHAYLPSGAELPGWPVYTNPLPFHSGEPGFGAKGITTTPRGNVLGGVTVGDLFGDGRLEVVAADEAGYVYAWTAAGRALGGFPVRTNPNFSGPQVRDPRNRVLRGIFQAPALADLEGTGRLDIVASASDRHVYAWRPDGSAVPGWPRIVVDQAKVQSIDPVTNKVVFRPGVAMDQGTKVIDGPTIGAINGSGRPDVIVGSNEEYVETPNTSAANPLEDALSNLPVALSQGNSRVYAFDSGGNVLPGWPFADADWEMGLLPDVGDGTTNTPSLADVDGSGKLRVGVISTVGPAYVVNPDGTSYFGTGPDGRPLVASSEPLGPLTNSPVYPSIPSLGSPIFAPLGGAAPGVSLIAPASSVGKALDASFPGLQQPNDTQLDAWNLSTGKFQPAFPQVMNDLEFFDQPIVANVASGGPYVVEGSALADLRAINAEGQEAPGFPKFTGGWMVNGPAFGAFGGLSNQVLAAGTREGDLYVWQSTTGRCADPGPWPKLRHDLSNTGNLSWTGAASFTCTPPAGALKAGAAEVDITPPGWTPQSDATFTPICGATPAQVQQLWPGPRPYQFEEPYIDAAGAGRYVFGDPFCDANQDGRYDGIWVAGGSGQNKWAAYPPDPNPISAEAVVFANRSTRLAVVTVDSIGMFNTTFDAIRSYARTTAPRVQQVFVNSTHDESAPDPVGLWGPDTSTTPVLSAASTPTAVTSGVDEYYMDWMARRVADAIGRADRSLQPAQLRLGVGGLPSNVQSCWSSYPYIDDQLVHVMQAFNPASGRVIFTLVNGETHVETYAFSGKPQYTSLLSADWPGAMRQVLEKRYGGVALELTGIVGSVETPTVYEPESTVVPQVPGPEHDVPNPNGCHTVYPNPATGTPVTDARQFVYAYGQSMADDATAILGHAETASPSTLAGVDKSICVQLENNLFVAAFAAHLFPDRPAYTDPTCQGGGATAAVYPPSAPSFLKTDVALVTIGPAQLVYSPGEVFPFTEIRGAIDPAQMPFTTDSAGNKLPMTRWIAAELPAKYRFMAGLGQDMIGYLFPPGNFVGDTGETAEDPWLAYQLANNQPGDHDRFGHGHPDDSEAVGPHAGLAVTDALASLISGANGADIEPGLFVDAQGHTSDSPFASPGFGGAVGVTTSSGTYTVGRSASGWVTYEGLPDPGAAGTSLPYSVSTAGVSLPGGRVILIDVFAGAG